MAAINQDGELDRAGRPKELIASIAARDSAAGEKNVVHDNDSAFSSGSGRWKLAPRAIPSALPNIIAVHRHINCPDRELELLDRGNGFGNAARDLISAQRNSREDDSDVDRGSAR